jgi:membrane fusion protein (multidrug efflux system)
VRLRGAERAHAIAVPQQAVVQGDRGAYVWTVGPGEKAQQRVVETGEWSGNDWIINSGLHAGDRVVVENVIRVAPDALLKAVPASLPSAGSSMAGVAGMQRGTSPVSADPASAGAARASAPTGPTPAHERASTTPTTATGAGSADASSTKPSSSSAAKRGDVATSAVVLFDVGSAAITTDAAATLAPIVAGWHDIANGRAAISGYVDASGSKAANERLAEARAKAVRAALIVAGIPKDRIEMRTPANIVAGETNDARHVEISLIGDARAGAAGDRR